MTALWTEGRRLPVHAIFVLTLCVRRNGKQRPRSTPVLNFCAFIRKSGLSVHVSSCVWDGLEQRPSTGTAQEHEQEDVASSSETWSVWQGRTMTSRTLLSPLEGAVAPIMPSNFQCLE